VPELRSSMLYNYALLALNAACTAIRLFSDRFSKVGFDCW
jgi:hypothetical protein